MQTAVILSVLHPSGYKNVETIAKIIDKICIEPVTECNDFPRKDCRQNEIKVHIEVMQSSAKLRHMKQYANFQKNGKISVEVVSEKVAHSNKPDESFLHRELKPNDGYRVTLTLFEVICDGFDSAMSQCGENNETMISIVAKTDSKNQTSLKEEKLVEWRKTIEKIFNLRSCTQNNVANFFLLRWCHFKQRIFRLNLAFSWLISTSNDFRLWSSWLYAKLIASVSS